MIDVTLLSTYELGRQPFGVASPAAWLTAGGCRVTCVDLAVETPDEGVFARADLVAFYLPMHTATRLALRWIDRVRRVNPGAHVCGYGLYAPLNERHLRERGVETILGGEFESGLASLARRLGGDARGGEGPDGGSFEPSRGGTTSSGRPRGDGRGEPAGRAKRSDRGATVSLGRQRFLVPDRRGLPGLERYARLRTADGDRLVGYTEASRGCKHRCRHCPIVPVYDGRFRVVDADVVLADVEQQVGCGARHVTFGDPDFLNGPKHALRVVRSLHERFPELTYDVTIKVEHLLAHADLLPVLRETGCLFVTSAVEALDDATLRCLDKGHTAEDVVEAVRRMRRAGLTLNPTFVTFTPWTTLDGYLDLLEAIDELGLVENVAPVQYAIRLLITNDSRLLELDEVRSRVGPFDPAGLVHPWAHADPRVDRLHETVRSKVRDGQREDASRAEIHSRVVDAARDARGGGRTAQPLKRSRLAPVRPRVTVPYLTEPWYC